ncbi:conserved hypothetical protein [Renibacterium salmoninarum ATCC 33209]|uniref:Flavin reductase like domain-containing protein n=1 Tax=Renibacterium salmoninarum (strain ATCC 33209 / DSM 20767 / JCM 11484 / NBRC 15589 / NCIMB 2235) TaxID=288705 RepID=A9WRK4_RENSM|nr:flavin reductase family protein [Renibacterium salmoninarum]ABY24286.1 conserved hypothetical protein [Renibacterium salmoninarum ATCC 33209]
MSIPQNHLRIQPAILYFGTPVVLISTLNPDNTVNVAPISSIFWLAQRAVIGISASSQTAQNLLGSKECVLNLPAAEQSELVNALALTTGNPEISINKTRRGYRYVSDKAARAGISFQASEEIKTPRVAQCPVQQEAKLVRSESLMADVAAQAGKILTMELEILAVHILPELRMAANQ